MLEYYISDIKYDLKIAYYIYNFFEVLGDPVLTLYIPLHVVCTCYKSYLFYIEIR